MNKILIAVCLLGVLLLSGCTKKEIQAGDTQVGVILIRNFRDNCFAIINNVLDGTAESPEPTVIDCIGFPCNQTVIRDNHFYRGGRVNVAGNNAVVSGVTVNAGDFYYFDNSTRVSIRRID